MKLEIISKETIKPSSPTPTHLRTFKLSLLDQLFPLVNGNIIFFYSNNHQSPSETSQYLKKSLSETLTLFYPLAGKTVDNMIIDCNDNGALFVEAKVDISMSSFLQQPDGYQLSLFLPTEFESTGFFTLVQLTFFTCGGVGIDICVSHKLGDAVTAATFMKSWAENMIGSCELTRPVYEAARLFPARECFSTQQVIKVPEQRFPLKRLVFDSAKLASLKVDDYKPSKSEIVTAIIWKSALKAARSNSRSSHSVMHRAVNIRRRVSPPLAFNSVGNIMQLHVAVQDESEVDLRGLVRELRKGLEVFDEMFVKNLKTEEGLEHAIGYLLESRRVMTRENVELYFCSSLCNMSLYDVDFGWGRPVWVTAPAQNTKNLMMLVDGNGGDGSVEAWVVLCEEDMYLFERDPELLAYASLNPSVCPVVKSCM